jgi:hypothetical protein
VPELATKTAILACPFRFDRFALGESNAKQLETYFQLRVSHGSVATGNATEATRTRAAQLLLVSCLGDFAPELQRAIAAIPPSRNSSEGGGAPNPPSESERTAIAFLQLVNSAVDALQTAGGSSAPSPSPLQTSSTRNARSIVGGMGGSSRHGPGGSLGGGSMSGASMSSGSMGGGSMSGGSMGGGGLGGGLGEIDLAAIAIGAYQPRWFMKASHIDPTEAVQVMRDLRARSALAIHWGTFEGLSDEPLDQPPLDLRRAIESQPQRPDFRVLRHGQTWRIN